MGECQGLKTPHRMPYPPLSICKHTSEIVMTQQTRFSFTQRSIESLPDNPQTAKSTETEYSDSQVPGLKLLVGKTGTKKFLLRYTFLSQKKSIALHLP